MLALLAEMSDSSLFNVFRYITFRTGGALITAALIVFIFGRPIIDKLRVKQGKGQPIRADGPQTHFKKAGTPTMGGLMILAAIVASTLIWANLSSGYVWVVLMVTLGFGGIGFYVWHRLKFHSAIWHSFVTAAAACHYAGITHAMIVA